MSKLNPIIHSPPIYLFLTSRCAALQKLAQGKV